MKLFDSAIGRTITTRPKRFRALSSRCGVFPYLINGDLVWQYRPDEEVFNQDSIDSFLDASITIGHPNDDSDLLESHGTIYKVESVSDSSDTSGIYCEFVVFTDDAKNLASSGTPTSPMYDVLLVEQKGEYQGKAYNYIQKNIRYSSLGLVSNARQETTKVFYQLSKDSKSNLLLPENLIEVPIIQTEKIMKNKLADKSEVAPLVPNILTSEVSQIKEEPETISETPTVSDTDEIVLDSSEFSPENSNEISPEQKPVFSEVTTNLVETTTPEVSNVPNDSTEPTTNNQNNKVFAEINCDGGVNIQRDYLDEAIDVAKRASDMGLLGFNEAMQYSLSSMNTLMRMILLKEGVEVDEWEDARGAYKVYMKLRPLSSSTPVTNSDSAISQSKPLIPKINHPLHVKKTPDNRESVTVRYFDDLE